MPPRRMSRTSDDETSPLQMEQNDKHIFTTKIRNTKDALTFSHNRDEYINEIDRLYYWASFGAVFVWIFLVLVSYWISWDRLERLEGSEKTIPFLATMMLGMCCITTLTPLLIRKKRVESGIVIAALTVQFLALMTDIILANLPVPVMLNPLTNTKIYMLRWCEWSPLAFLMTFVTDTCRIGFRDKKGARNTSGERISSLLSVMRKQHKKKKSNSSRKGRDIEDDREKALMRNLVKLELRSSYQLSFCQGLSTLCGLVFPFCSNVWSYGLVLIISVSLFSTILFRLQSSKKILQSMTPGNTHGEKELYVWAQMSHQLLRSCAILWSVLVVAYFIYTFGPILLPSIELFRLTWFTMLVEATIDVLYKAIYMLIIVDVHERIFDPKARTNRRLEDLRQMIGVVWYNSSDVICISVKGGSGDVTTLLSPTYLRLYSGSAAPDLQGMKKSFSEKAVAFDLVASELKNLSRISDESLSKGEINIIPTAAYDVEFDQDNAMFAGQSSSRDSEHLGSMAQLVARAWKAKEEKKSHILMHDLVRLDGDSPLPIRCEANISIMEKNVLVIVVRDISERFRRFEAEKQVISETTARRKDAAANRFTRHEVKNGLLAAIGLCDSLSDVSHQNESGVAKGGISKLCTSALASATHLPNDNSRYVAELSKTLKEILDTVLAEAMARDVIHEIYEPKLERVDLSSLLTITTNPSPNDARSKRYPIHTNISPWPEFSLDPQLWKYIHRNAVSNACKYGKASGTVTTELHWDEINQILRMNVINQPGENHDVIMNLGSKASEIIFSPRMRLSVHTTIDGNNHASASHSAGDGAWIMHKCAKTLGGECTINFETGRTIFTFQCPASVYDETADVQFDATFSLPPNVYAIAVDDSSIQRRILNKFFTYVGIPSHRIFVHGSNASEITGFSDWALNFIYNHPNDYFLFIVDENLVIQDDQFTQVVTISGSMSISKLRSRLLPDQEKRVLALIRSANDSARDIAIYNSRAHGHIAKEPIKKDTCIDLIARHWITRFPKMQRISSENLFGIGKNRKREISKNESWESGLKPKKRSKSLHGLRRRSDIGDIGGDYKKRMKRSHEDKDNSGIISNLKRKKDTTFSDSSDTSYGLTLCDCMDSIEEIDFYIESNANETLHWDDIRSKLHALKGDLLMIDKPSTNLQKGLKMISNLKRDDQAHRLKEQWQSIRMMITT